MPGIYKTTRHPSRSAVTPEMLSGEQDNTAKNITLPGLSPAGEGAIPPPVLAANESPSLPRLPPSSSLSDDSVSSVSSPPSGNEETPSSVLPASETRETLPISRLIRPAWEQVDDSSREDNEALPVYDTERDNSDGVSPWRHQGGACAVPRITENDRDSLFSFIDKEHLQEAQEFRRKGYNRQVPGVDPGLVMQLREAVAAAKSRPHDRATVVGPLDSLWMMIQKDEIVRFTAWLSEDRMQDWVRDELPDNGRGEAGEASLGSRRAAQSLVRRLESVLQMLIRVAHILSSVDAYGTPEKRRDMLVAELVHAFPSCVEDTVIQALERMTAEAEGQTAWSSLMEARTAAWKVSHAVTFGAMSRTTWHEAEKACKKARQLQGDAQAFFTAIDLYFCKLSNDFRRASVNVSQSASPLSMQNVNEEAAPSSRSDSLIDKAEMGFVKKKLQLKIVAEGVKTQIHRFNRVRQHGHPSATLSKTSEQVTHDSMIRSILWQWQQPAIKIQYASGALLSKVDELQAIEGMLSSWEVAHDKGRVQEGSETPVSHPGEDDMVAQVRQWVIDRTEEAKPENQQTEKLTVLKKLLDGDIATARALVERLGNTGESIQNMLRQKRFVVLKMIMSRSDLPDSLLAVDALMPKIARDLTASMAALDKAGQAATTRNFAEAKKQAGYAQLLATKVKEKLSAESARLTQRPLDEHSRGSRLAKHWANIAREQNLSNYPSPDAEQVFSSLERQGLLAGTLSSGDPEGYLFATRFAGELENARNDELRLPMSPEQYAALEKGLVEYIVKWGQKRLSRGGIRLVIELAFEQGLDTVTFRLSNLFRLPYKVLMASIKIPYSVHKVNNYTLPGQDKPYKAIYSLLGKKLKQLGFNLITAPLPGVVKLGIGAAVTAGAAVYNLYAGNKEKTFSAVYQRVAEGKKSEKIKMSSPGGMLFDAVVDGATTAAVKGTRLAWKSGKNKVGGALNKPFVNDNSFDINKVTLPKTQWGKAETENDNTAGMNAAENGRDVGLASPASPLPQQDDVKPFSDNRDPTSEPHRIRRKRAVENEPAVQSHQETVKEPVKATSLSDFDGDPRYQDLSDEQKKEVYRRAIDNVLFQIEHDKKIPDVLRNRALLARLGKNNLLIAQGYIKGNIYILNNMLLLPDPSKKSIGVLIRLNSEVPYQYIEKMEDYPHGSKEDAASSVYDLTDSGLMNISTISSRLADRIDIDYKLKNKIIENKLLMARANGIVLLSDTEATDTEVVSVPGMKNKIAFASDAHYQNLSEDQKRQAYYYNLKRITCEIWIDETIPVHIRSLLSNTAMERPVFMDVVIGKENYKLNNTLLLPDPTGKSLGVLIRLNSKRTYVYLKSAKDIPQDLINDMPYGANNPGLYYHPETGEFRGTSSTEYFSNIKNWGYDPLNSVHQKPMGMSAASDYLVKTIEADYKDKNKVIGNKLLVFRAAQNYFIERGRLIQIGSEKEPETEPDQVTQETVHLGNIDFNHGIRYIHLSREEKIHAYSDAIKFKLLQIEKDDTLPEHIRNRAYMGRLGAKILIPTEMLADNSDNADDIIAIKQSNTVFLPDNVSAKSGILIYLNSEEPHKYINQGKYDFEDPELDMKLNRLRDATTTISPIIGRLVFWVLDKMGLTRPERDIPETMNISDISTHFADNIEYNYTLTDRPLDHRLLISNSIAGAQIPKPNAALIEVHDEYIYRRKSDSIFTDYLRFIQHPFSTISGDFQLIASTLRGETMQETDLHVHEAEYWGSWVDVTVGAVASFTPEGIILNAMQSSAGILADLSEDKEPDELAIVGLVASCLPGAEGKIVASIGKVSRIGGQFVKYTMRVGNKIIDLTFMGRSIKEAVETGDPLAIYQAFLNSGMSAKDSYHIARNMSLKLKISKPIEHSASLEQLEAIHSNAPGYAVSPTMPVRTFKIGQTQLHGKINKGEIEISRDGGATWEQGSELHRLAYRLQNAGGGRKLPAGSQYEPHTPGYQKDYSIDLKGFKALEAKVKLKMSKAGTRVQRFNEETNSYYNVDDYEVVPYQTTIPDVDTLLDDRVARQALEDMRSKYKLLKNIAIDYTGSRATDLQENLQTGEALISEMLRGLPDSPSATTLHFLLIEKTAGPITANNILGIGKIVDLPAGDQPGERSSIIMESVVAHPYTLISKNESFLQHAASKGLHLSQEDRTRYNLKRIGGQLMRDGLKKTLKKINKEVKHHGRTGIPKNIQFSSRNPITARMAEGFGARRTGEMDMPKIKFVNTQKPKTAPEIITRDSLRLIAEPLNLDFTELEPLTSAQKQACDTTRTLLEGDNTIRKYIATPAENCANAAKKVTELLTQNGYTNIRFAELGIWGSDYSTPNNHFVVLANHNGVDITVDITAGQFRRGEMQGPIYNTTSNWKLIVKRAFGRGVRQPNLVKYKEFSVPFNINTHATPVKDLFGPNKNPFETIEGGEILARPRWHTRVFDTMPLRENSYRHFDNVIDRTLSAPNGASSAENPWEFVLQLQSDAGLYTTRTEERLLQKSKSWRQSDARKFFALDPRRVSSMDQLSKIPKGSRLQLTVVNTGSKHPMLSLGGGNVISVDNTWMGPNYGAGIQKISLLNDLQESPEPNIFNLKGARGEIEIHVEQDGRLPTIESLSRTVEVPSHTDRVCIW